MISAMISDLIIAIMAIILLVAVFYIPIALAKRLGRNVLGWLIFALFFSPLLAIIFY
ncbi:MAG: hypothetical protein H6Q16_461 [Bacteroidetes bacterium]|nr:hypothetical protein [Bacteroidota bacterium]